MSARRYHTLLVRVDGVNRFNHGDRVSLSPAFLRRVHGFASEAHQMTGAVREDAHNLDDGFTAVLWDGCAAARIIQTRNLVRTGESA